MSQSWPENHESKHVPTERKEGGPDDERLDRTGNSGTSVEAALWSVSIHLWDTVKPKVFVGVAMVWLQAKMGPAAQVEPVWEHHKTTPDPLQDPLAARHHIGEQVSSSLER